MNHFLKKLLLRCFTLNIVDDILSLTNFSRSSILDVWQGSEYASTGNCFESVGDKKRCVKEVAKVWICNINEGSGEKKQYNEIISALSFIMNLSLFKMTVPVPSHNRYELKQLFHLILHVLLQK